MSIVFPTPVFNLSMMAILGGTDAAYQVVHVPRHLPSYQCRSRHFSSRKLAISQWFPDGHRGSVSAGEWLSFRSFLGFSYVQNYCVGQSIVLWSVVEELIQRQEDWGSRQHEGRSLHKIQRCVHYMIVIEDHKLGSQIWPAFARVVDTQPGHFLVVLALTRASLA